MMLARPRSVNAVARGSAEQFPVALVAWHSAAMTLSLASVSVDLDPLRCYHQIHGLGPVPEQLTEVVLQRALPRFLEVFDRFGLASTLFVVGSDALDGMAGRPLLREAARLGHELGNHSFGHPYDLSRGSESEIEHELVACEQILDELRGKPGGVCGFRAPGYELSESLLSVLARLGFRYDSSVFPCPPYYLAKLAVLAKLRLQGRHSASIIGSPWQQLAPSQPYRPALQSPNRRGSAPLVELPVAVTPWLRLPAIGTFLLLSSPLRKLLLHGMTAQPFFNLELHGIDLIDAQLDGIPPELVARQPDLQLPLWQKQAALVDILRFLIDHAALVPLAVAAQRFG